jgi:hypothetical protein
MVIIHTAGSVAAGVAGTVSNLNGTVPILLYVFKDMGAIPWRHICCAKA